MLGMIKKGGSKDSRIFIIKDGLGQDGINLTLTRCEYNANGYIDSTDNVSNSIIQFDIDVTDMTHFIIDAESKPYIKTGITGITGFYYGSRIDVSSITGIKTFTITLGNSTYYGDLGNVRLYNVWYE